MILENLKDIRRRMDAAARRRGRDPRGVELVAVTKYAAVEPLRELLRSGALSFVGENKVQDALKRREALGADARRARWRFIGHLQTNKARHALEAFDSVDTVDSLRLAEALSGRLPPGRVLPVLVQVKLAERETQSGVAPEDLPGMLDALRRFPNLAVSGLMAIAPMLEPVERVRSHFRGMRELFERHFLSERPPVPEPRLSLGMSGDFEIAIEEGANLVRVGSALFAAGDEERFIADTLPTQGGSE